MKILIAFILSFLLTATIRCEASDSSADINSVLPITKVSATSEKHLNSIDSFIACSKLDSIIILRGDSLYSVSMLPPFKETFLAKDPLFTNRVLTDIFWLDGPVVLLNRSSWDSSAGILPVCYVHKSHKAFLSIDPTLTVGASYRAYLPALAADHKTGIISLQFAGPGPANKENCTQYCWTNFVGRKIKYLPRDWNPHDVNADFTGMIFTGPSPRCSRGAPLSAPPIALVNFKDGSLSDLASDMPQTKIYNWRGHSDIFRKQLIYFTGLDDTYCVQSISKDERQFFPRQIADGYCLANTGTNLWLVPLLNKNSVHPLTTDAGEFAILSDGKCIYTDMSKFYNKDLTSGMKPQIQGVFFHDYKKNVSFDLWQDFPLVPSGEGPFKWDGKHFAGWDKNPLAVPYKINKHPLSEPHPGTIWNRRYANIMIGFGSDKFPALAFVQLRHEVMDMDQSPNNSGIGGTHMQNYIIDSKCRRLIPLPDISQMRNILVALVHNAGTIVVEQDEWVNRHKTISLDLYNFPPCP